MRRRTLWVQWRPGTTPYVTGKPMGRCFFVIAVGVASMVCGGASNTSTAPSPPANTLLGCQTSSLVQAEPPRDPNADPFGQGPWYINGDRTIWAGWDAGRWTVGWNKVLWIRPAGTDLVIEGRRVDGDAPPITTDIPCCYRTGFQSTRLFFPTDGCWRVTANAGHHTLTFITAVIRRVSTG